MSAHTNAPAVYRIDVTLRLVPQTCISCGVLFGLESAYDEQRVQDHKSFYCPNGHAQTYCGKTDVQIAEEQRDAARSLAERESNRRRLAELAIQAARRSGAAHKGWATRIRNRIANGVCPCCNRSFENVRRHIETQHPDFAIPVDSE